MSILLGFVADLGSPRFPFSADHLRHDCVCRDANLDQNLKRALICTPRIKTSSDFQDVRQVCTGNVDVKPVNAVLISGNKTTAAKLCLITQGLFHGTLIGTLSSSGSCQLQMPVNRPPSYQLITVL